MSPLWDQFECMVNSLNSICGHENPCHNHFPKVNEEIFNIYLMFLPFILTILIILTFILTCLLY